MTELEEVPDKTKSYWFKFKAYLKGLKAKYKNRKKNKPVVDNSLPEPQPVPTPLESEEP